MNRDEQHSTVANAATNPFASPVAIEDHSVVLASAHEAPPLPPARLISIRGIVSALLILGIFAATVYLLVGEKQLLPTMLIFQTSLLAIWLGVGRGPLGVRLLVTAGGYFYLRFLILLSPAIPENVMMPQTTIFLFAIAMQIALVDLTLLAITPASRAVLRVTPIRFIMGVIGLIGVALAWGDPFLIFLSNNTESQLIVLRIACLMCPLVAVVAIPLVFRKHGRTRGKWITTLGIAVVMLVLTSYIMHFDLGNSAFFFLIVGPLVQLAIGSLVYALDYLLRCGGLSLVAVPTTGEIENG
ncbi:hypothetical protein [Blastopirellula marina]|uniref:Uncharacterized protein n=1 Tax=Blastopirellula marina TaxID=124 RepID=A0A2S8FLG9_9BACT|nr:hypothetical protein [Blastopirellula marina]PQO32997.1 hypothetical protein C5Y98_17830 [Blastopirellula marina]PTL43164.1 hypothetical protein C5Y97_17840 [Blastopirellula marina]